MNLEIASSVALILAAVFNILPFVMKLYDRIKAKRLRFQRLFIYAQLAEKFVQWGGLVPSPAGKDDDEADIRTLGVARDDGRTLEPYIERFARSENLRRMALNLHTLKAEVDSPGTRVERLDGYDPLRPLAYVLTGEGYIGPFPYAWVNGIKSLDRKGKARPACIKVLPDTNPGKDSSNK